MTSSIEQWPAPNDAVAFESLCLDLWKAIWGDPNTQKNGRSGHPQAGVDVFGQKDGLWIGIQCKKKDGTLRSKLTERELRNEVTNAKTFSPQLKQFIVATTSSRDPKLQEVARELTEIHQSEELFSVHVWAWEDIWSELYQHSALLEQIAETYWGKLYSLRKQKHSAAHNKLREAEDLMQQGGKRKDAFELIQESLRLAREARNQEEEIDALLAAAIVSSDRGGYGDTRHYIGEAERLVSKIGNPASKVIFYRAKAKACRVAKDDAGAEIAFQTGLQIAETETDDEKRNLSDQACLLREAYVHFLCDKKRLDNVPTLLDSCESYARLYPASRGGALLQAALEAGLHYHLEIGDESGVRSRIDELKDAANTAFFAKNIGGGVINVANHAAHLKLHELGLYAAQTAIGIAQIADPENTTGFLVGCLYTEAQILAQLSRYSEAQKKAQSLLQVCDPTNDQDIFMAVNILLSEIDRLTGDASSAVLKSKQAVAHVAGQPPHVVAMAKMQQAIALSDSGATQAAVNELLEVWALMEHTSPPDKFVLDLFAHLADYASQIGQTDVTHDAIKKIKELQSGDAKVDPSIEAIVNRVESNSKTRERILETCFVDDSIGQAGRILTLQEENQCAFSSLLEWWDDCRDSFGQIYDFWGRGNFSRLLNNSRKHTGSFSITLEVRTLEEVKRAVRLWGLYADFLMLIWKGPTETFGMSMAPFPKTYGEKSIEIGGHGYAVTAGSQLKREGSSKVYFPAICFAGTALPDFVTQFLATEAKPLLKLGKLVVVPAAAIGCVHPGHGPFEQLIADACDAIPGLRANGQIESPISLIPYSPDAPLEVIAELTERESSTLRRLRTALRRRSMQQPLTSEAAQRTAIKSLELEIADALSEIGGQIRLAARRQNFSNESESIGSSHSRFHQPDTYDDSAVYSPILTLQSMGYQWKVGTPLNQLKKNRFELEGKQVVGTWLVPPTGGWTFPMVRV